MSSLPTFAIGVVLAELHRRGFEGDWPAPFALVLVPAFAGHYNSRYAGLNFVLTSAVFARLPCVRHR